MYKQSMLTFSNFLLGDFGSLPNSEEIGGEFCLRQLSGCCTGEIGGVRLPSLMMYLIQAVIWKGLTQKA